MVRAEKSICPLYRALKVAAVIVTAMSQLEFQVLKPEVLLRPYFGGISLYIALT